MRFRRILTATCVVSPWNLCVGEGHDCRWGRRVAARRGPDHAVERDHGHRTRRDSATFAPSSENQASENQAGENQVGSPFARARAARRPDWSPETGGPAPPEETDERAAAAAVHAVRR